MNFTIQATVATCFYAERCSRPARYQPLLDAVLTADGISSLLDAVLTADGIGSLCWMQFNC
jgi:hypothetical protein